MKSRTSLIALAILGGCIAAGPRASAADITVTKDTDVPLVFDQPVSSKTAKAGDRIAMHVASDVVVNGKTVIPMGTKVTGIVSKVEKRKHFGVNAKLRLAFDPIRVHGARIDIEPKDKGKYTGTRTDQAGAAAGGGALLLGPLGLAGGYFVVGKQVNIKVGDTLVTDVVHDTIVRM